MLKKNQRDGRYTDLTSAYAEQPDVPEGEYTMPQQQPQQARNQRGRELDEETEIQPQSQQPQRPARAESVVDAESTFDGKYETAQDLRVLGSISGEIVCSGQLTIERDARAKAKIQARDVQIRGVIEGDVVCSGRLLVTSSGVITGTIKTATLVVEEGATVRGTIETTGSGASITELPDRRERENTRETKEKEGDESSSSGRNGGSGRWNSRTREVPSFALVSSEERAASDRN
ncbi:MAG: bactofilin family protein [Hyphomicrobiales bacterium]